MLSVRAGATAFAEEVEGEKEKRGRELEGEGALQLRHVALHGRLFLTCYYFFTFGLFLSLAFFSASHICHGEGDVRMRNLQLRLAWPLPFAA